MFVHGCGIISPQLARSLSASVDRIDREVAPRQTHIFSYNAAKLLHKGQPRFRELCEDLLGEVKHVFKSSPPSTTFAFVAYNTGIWLVQEVILQWQYNELGHMPVGIVTCGLPNGSFSPEWNIEDYKLFLAELMKHFRKEHKERTLKFDVIKASTVEFEDLIKYGLRMGMYLPKKDVAHTEHAPDDKVSLHILNTNSSVDQRHPSRTHHIFKS